MAHDIESKDSDTASLELLEESTRGPGVVGGVHTPSFLVTAYRWGCTNEHAYHVYGGPDRHKALALALAENSYRGGKYATVVWEFDSDGTDYKAIAYNHSSCCLPEAVLPRHNHRIDYFERIGQFVAEARSGRALQPDPNDAKRLTYQEVSPLPGYLLAECDRQEAFLRIWENFDETHRESKVKPS